MKNILITTFLLISLNTFSQTFNIDNLDSCKNFLCNKVWITRFSEEPALHILFPSELAKYEKPMMTHENEPIVAKIRFYKNQTFKINYKTFEETGKWYFESAAKGLYRDSVHDRIEIGWVLKKPHLTTGDTFLLIDATVTKKAQCEGCAYLPKVPYFYRKTNGSKAYEGYYVQE